MLNTLKIGLFVTGLMIALLISTAEVNYKSALKSIQKVKTREERCNVLKSYGFDSKYLDFKPTMKQKVNALITMK